MIYRICIAFCAIVIAIIRPMRLVGSENIPESGGAIIVANHTSNWDPVLIALSTYRFVHFLGKIELFKNKFAAWFFRSVGVIPVDRKKVAPRTVINCLKDLKRGEVLGIFPEGTRVKDQHIEPNDGFVVFAIRAKVPIIPIHIFGVNKLFHPTNVIVGKPIYLSQYFGKKPKGQELQDIANSIMKEIYQLK